MNGILTGETYFLVFKGQSFEFLIVNPSNVLLDCWVIQLPASTAHVYNITSSTPYLVKAQGAQDKVLWFFPRLLSYFPLLSSFLSFLLIPDIDFEVLNSLFNGKIVSLERLPLQILKENWTTGNPTFHFRIRPICCIISQITK